MGSSANCMEFGILIIVICLVFVFCYLKFFIVRHLNSSFSYNMLPNKTR
jgi:hypothetical protein